MPNRRGLQENHFSLQKLNQHFGYIDIRANADLLSCSPQWIDYGCVQLQMEPGEFGRVSPNM